MQTVACSEQLPEEYTQGVVCLPSSGNKGCIRQLLERLQAFLGVVHLNDVHGPADSWLHHMNVQQVEFVQLLQQVVVQRVWVCKHRWQHQISHDLLQGLCRNLGVLKNTRSKHWLNH